MPMAGSGQGAASATGQSQRGHRARRGSSPLPSGKLSSRACCVPHGSSASTQAVFKEAPLPRDPREDLTAATAKAAWSPLAGPEHRQAPAAALHACWNQGCCAVHQSHVAILHHKQEPTEA